MFSPLRMVATEYGCSQPWFYTLFIGRCTVLHLIEDVPGVWAMFDDGVLIASIQGDVLTITDGKAYMVKHEEWKTRFQNSLECAEAMAAEWAIAYVTVVDPDTGEVYLRDGEYVPSIRFDELCSTLSKLDIEPSEVLIFHERGE